MQMKDKQSPYKSQLWPISANISNFPLFKFKFQYLFSWNTKNQHTGKNLHFSGVKNPLTNKQMQSKLTVTEGNNVI